MDGFSLSRRGWVRSISYLTAGFFLLLGIILSQRQTLLRSQRALALTQLHAFDELASAVGELDLSLEKAAYATTPTLVSQLCSQIDRQAAVATLSLGELPYGNVELEQTAAFVARVGDYAAALSRSIQTQGGWTAETLDTWQALSAQADTLSQQLAALEADLQSGARTLESAAEAEARMSALEEGDDLSLDGVYQPLEEGYDQLPTLIYDGPFSQHLDSQSPAALEGLDDITQEEAVAAALAFLDMEDGLAVTSTLSGSIPGWLIEGTLHGTAVSVEVSQAGGQIIQYTRPCQPDSQRLSYEEGVSLAGEFLDAQGLTQMTERYYQAADGVLTVNFAYQQDGVVCYPDLIKVSVALDTGEIVGYEAKGYLTSHRQRTFSPPVLTQGEAEALVPHGVTVQSARLVVIPTPGGDEVTCWEVAVEGESGRQVLYYWNAATGGEEQILLLQVSASGTLVE